MLRRSEEHVLEREVLAHDLHLDVIEGLDLVLMLEDFGHGETGVDVLLPEVFAAFEERVEFGAVGDVGGDLPDGELHVERA